MRRVAVVLSLLFAVTGAAHAANNPVGPVYDAKGRIIETPLAPPEQPKRLTPGKAVDVFLAYPKVKVEIVIPSGRYAEVLTALADAARTGKIGDGKIFVYEVAEAIRIRNDDRGEAAL